MTSTSTKKTKAELQTLYARDNKIGLSYLWKLSHQALTIHPGLVGYYMNHFQRLSILTETKLNNSIKSRYCQCCGVLFVPGLTCLVTVKSSSKTPKKETKNIVSFKKPKLDPEEFSVPPEASIEETSSTFKTRVYTIFNSSNNRKAQKKSKSSIKIRQPSSKLIIYKCNSCNSKTCLVEKFTKPEKKINELTSSAPKAAILSSKTQTNLAPQKILPDKVVTSKPSKDKKIKKPNPSQLNLAKSTFKPASSVAKGPKKGKLNLSKLLENDKKAKAQEKASQSFSLGDFLKKIND